VASDNFNRDPENPLASPWGVWHSGSPWPQLDLVSNAVKNNEGGAGDVASLYTTSNELLSQCVITTVGGRDAGPTICSDGNGNGYFFTNHDATNLYIYLISGGSFNNIGSVAGVYATNDVLKLRRSGNNVIASINGGDVLTVADTTYMTGNPGMLCFDTTSVLDDWTDGVAGGPPPAECVESIEMR